MQIFHAFFKIAGKLKGTLIMYIAIFFTIGIITTSATPDTSAVFEESRLKVVLFDEDETPESRALCDFIAERHDIVELENDPEMLWDQLYYHKINYVLTVEDGYAEKLRKGETEDLFTYSVDPQSYASEYLNMQLRQYVSTLDLFLATGEDLDAAQADTLEVLADGTEVTAVNFNASDASPDLAAKFTIFMRFLAYILPAIMITVLSRIIIELRGENMRSRTLCAPVTPLQYNGQIIGASMILCTALWLLMLLISFAYGGFPALTENVLLAVLNSFLFMLISVGIGVFISMCFSSNSMVIDMIANIICLGMAFLCGVFVDQTLLGESVLSIAKFIPAYWYVCAIDNIGQISGAVFSAATVWKCMGMELLFAAALFAASMVVSRYKKV